MPILAHATQSQLQAMPLAPARARFQTQLQAVGRSPHTVVQYARHVGRFGEWLEAEGEADDVRELEPEHVDGFITAIEAQRRRDGGPRRAGSLNALRSSLRGFFGYLERAGIVERSPARVLRRARVGAPAPRRMRADDVAKLLSLLAADTSPAGPRDHALVAFLARTSARLGSALALDLEDLDLAAGAATLRELKGGGEMTVFLRPDLVAILAKWAGDRRSGPVFAACGGDALTPRHRPSAASSSGSVRRDPRAGFAQGDQFEARVR